MYSPKSVPDIFKSLVANVSQVVGYTVHFKSGTKDVINNELKNSGNEKYPMIALVDGWQENPEDSTIMALDGLTLIIAVRSTPTERTQARNDNNYIPFIFPIYKALCDVIADSSFFTGYNVDFKHKVRDWKNMGLDDGQQLFEDCLDGRVLEDISLRLNLYNCSEDVYTPEGPVILPPTAGWSQWGNIFGNIEDQVDLVAYVAEHGGGSGDFVPYTGATGDVSLDTYNLTAAGLYTNVLWLLDTPMGEYGSITLDTNRFAFKDFGDETIFAVEAGNLEIKNANGTTFSNLVMGNGNYTYTFPNASGNVALEAWVTGQSYITSAALTGYATESWVTGQNYITAAALTGYATESWVTGQNYITAAALSGLVPYTGAVSNLSLGANSLFASNAGIGLASGLSATFQVRGTSTVSGTAALFENSGPNPLLAILNNGNVGFGTSTPTYRVELLNNGLGTTFDELTGFTLANRTAATAGLMQHSPTLTFEGQSWLTTAPIGSKSVKFKMGIVSVTNSNLYLGDLDFQTSVDGNTYRSAFKIQPRYSSTAGGGFAIPNNASILWGIPSISSNGSRMTFNARGGNFTAGEYHYTFATSADTIQITSGLSGHVRYTTTFNPTSGTATFAMMSLFPTINQTGGANGITRGILYSPTLTSAANHVALEVVLRNNANDTFVKFNNGAVDVLCVKGDSKIGMYNATPVAQGTTAMTGAPYVHVTSTAVHSDSTFDGYTIGQVVRQIRNIGILQ